MTPAQADRITARGLSTAAQLSALFTSFEAETRRILATANDAPTCGRALGELIAQERRAAKLSLDDVAERAGLTKSHIWELEKERSVNPTVAACHGVATALGLSFEVVCDAALVSWRRGPRGKGDAA